MYLELLSSCSLALIDIARCVGLIKKILTSGLSMIFENYLSSKFALHDVQSKLAPTYLPINVPAQNTHVYRHLKYFPMVIMVLKWLPCRHCIVYAN